MSLNRTVCILEDDNRFVVELAELLDRQDYSIFQEDDVDCFITMIADIDPDLTVITDTVLSTDEPLLPMLRLLTDNIIVVAGYDDGKSAADALMQGADLCVSQAMSEGELWARLHAFERRLLASTA